MLTSLSLLLKGTIRHWYQLAGGTAMAIVGLVAQINDWIIPGWIWGALTYLCFFGRS